MDSFYLYKKPGEAEFIGASGNATPGFHKDGFVIFPFYYESDAVYTIEGNDPLSIDAIPESVVYKEVFEVPEASTSEKRHRNIVEGFIKELGESEKAVACKVTCGNSRINLKETLLSLSDKYPNAMVFCFHTPASGTWIGASPELLLSRHGNQMKTMSLAGTKSSESDNQWDEKNIKEQRLVTEYISASLLNNGFRNFKTEGPAAYKVGKLRHLLTTFNIETPSDYPLENIFSLLRSFSPTPALCGFPKEKAFEMINRLEGFSRGYYGGFCGPIDNMGNFDFYVILRSIRIASDHWVMYSGGGITSESDPYSEWIETERKAASILEYIKTTK